MNDDEGNKDSSDVAGPSAGPLLFKKRNKGRSNLTKSNSPSPSPSSLEGRTAFSKSNEEAGNDVGRSDDEDGSGSSAAAVQRSVSSRGNRSNRIIGTAAGMKDRRMESQRKGISNLSFANVEDEDVDTKGEKSGLRIRKSAYAENDFNNEDVEMIDSSSQSAYNPASLAALKAENANKSKNIVDGELDGTLSASYQMMIDPTENESLTRNKFAADFSHDGIPSEAVIKAAKEKRKKAMENMISGSEDFISLNQSEPHPESRIPREEDEEGSGEEELAEFTGATERIALDKEGIEREKMLERQRRKEELEMNQDDETSDGSGKEWEESQMQREIVNRSRTRKGERKERSPFRPAPIPQATPLPTLETTSARLQKRITDLQESIENQEALHTNAKTQLEQLDTDESRNKVDIEKAAERESWFSEFEQFIVSMAIFLEKKMTGLQEIESDWIDHLALRTYMIQRARADALIDQISLFYGVPAFSLFAERDEQQNARPPSENGDALSSIRVARRPFAEFALAGKLSPNDQAAFDIAKNEVKEKANKLLEDVQAAEYREPAVRVSKTDEKGEHSVLHPASLVARFHRWRRIYPQEYSNAWAGLTLGSMWDFWIRKSMCGWDGLLLDEQEEKSFDQFHWYSEITHYTHKAQQQHNTNGVDQDGIVVGGDDEIMAHVFTNTIIPLLIRMCDKGAFDPWSGVGNASLIEIMEQISYILEKDNLRFQSLIASILRQFENQINALTIALSSEPAILPPAMAIESPNALLSCMGYIAKTILQNLIVWHRFVQAGQRPFLIDQVNKCIGKALLPLFEMAQHIVGGTELIKELSQDLIRKTARPGLLSEEIRNEVERFANI